MHSPNRSDINNRIQSIYFDNLYRNSFFIIITSITSGGLGFVFWMLAARIYPMEDVGVATALISSMTLILVLSKMGFDVSIIRYFPDMDKNRALGTAIIVSSLFALFFSVIFVAGTDYWSPDLDLLVPLTGILFIAIAITNVVLSLSGVAFTAVRKAKYYFFQNIVLGSRLLFLIPLACFGTLGLFGAYGASSILTLLFTLAYLNTIGIKPTFCIDRSFIHESFHFSVGNYISNIFILAPNNLLPIIALYVLGAETTAQYFIVFTMVSILFTIPNALSTSLLVEGSNGVPLRESVIKSITTTYAVLIPVATLFFIFGDSILSFIGKDYSGNSVFFGTMILSSFLVSGLYIYSSILRIRRETREILYLTGLLFVLLTVSSYYLMQIYGLNGMGYAWILGYGATIVVGGIRLLKKRTEQG